MFLSKEEELTVEEAAELLHVSAGFVLRLLAEGTLTRHWDRLSRAEVLEYRRVDRERRLAALAELVALDQELGFY